MMRAQAMATLSQILLVEDNPGDVRLTRESLRECQLANTLHVVDDGEKALAFVRRTGVYAGVPRPDVIILDLNLPRKDGREVLAELKADPDLRRIPVVILSSSAAERDVVKMYNLHANCYITKPMQLAGYMEIVQAIKEFWFGVVKLPPR